MSRCFPFPPPGYEKKARPDDENLLEKDKRKEKKHKKEKKDKNKKDKEKKDREGKHKKDKERSEEKRREKKDRKERHKDKKDKNKEKEKEKKRPSEDKNTAGPPECSTVDNPGSSCTQSDETSDFKFLVELGKRTRDDKATENLMVKKINLTGKICSESPGKVGVGTGNSDGNAMLKEKKTNDGKFCGQSNNADVGQQRKVEVVAGLVGNNVEKRMVHNKIDEHKNSESRGDRSNDRDREGKIKSNTERKNEKEPNKEQQLIAREKSRNAVCNDSNTGSLPLSYECNKNSNIGKRKELRINGFLHDDEIRPSKLQRHLSCSQEAVENGRNLKPSKTLTKSVPELVGMVNNHKLNSNLASSLPTAEDGSKLNVTLSDVQFASARQRTGDNHKVNNNVPSSRSTLEKGRTLETLKAGNLLASECCRSSVNHKVDDKVGLAHPVLENGEVEIHKAATLTAATLTAAGGHEAIGKSKVHNKEPKINGLIKDERPNGCSTKPSSSTVKQIVRKSPKPPHPDSKYLSKILAIPSLERLDFDEQEWLLGSNSLQKRKANPGSSQFEETKQVWAKALRLESADITALPYVIPY